ncbi:major facilitator superfamily domain-containing protein [Mycotypha africana]|uniref:major facilitator superfamily domain-containing protein n=1 Tax=Mycotypha africana TaxID=64632 RepID=UPI002301DC67|nr:major facilitator superfamily domain-containing protein [Mycotypha africana]KAI8987943.1 major facilitator superfamily domain-containing protein [Mycotypha africana]
MTRPQAKAGVTEASPLLQADEHKPSYNADTVPIIEESSDGCIIEVVTSSSTTTIENASAKTLTDEEIVSKRLNGASASVVMVGLWIGVGLAALDGSIVAAIYPQIGTEFKRSNEIVWIATMYLLSYTALQPLYGRISDVFGRRTALLFASIVFFIGSAMCGASNDLLTLIVSRTIAGIGGGGLNTMSAVIMSDLVSIRERGKYQGYANVAYSAGSVIGAPLGGIITDSIGWRYCFYINLPLLLLSLYVAICVLTDYNLTENRNTGSFFERLKKIDYLGSLAVVVTVICFLLATSMGGNSRPWSDPLVYGLLIFSFFSGAVFCYIEAKIAEKPLMPWKIITSRTPFACAMTNFFSVMGSMSVTFTTPIFFQGVLGYTTSQASLFFLPKVVALTCGSLSAGYWMARKGEYQKYITFSTSMGMIAMFLTSFWTTDTSFSFIILCLVLDGFSSGSNITTTLVAMLSCVEHSGKMASFFFEFYKLYTFVKHIKETFFFWENITEMATTTSVSYLFRSTGGVVGISVISTVFQGTVKKLLTERITGPNAKEIIEIARKSINEVRTLLPPDALAIVLDTYETAIRYSFYLCVFMSVLCFLSALFIQQFTLASKIK